MMRGMSRSRGMTLIELMIVVVIVGVLSVLAVTGYRKYTLQARNAEAHNFLGVIRASQEAYYQAFGRYCGTVAEQVWPAEMPAQQKLDWGQPAGAWRDLGVKSPGQVWFQYGLKAGLAADAVDGAAFPGGQPVGPWYQVQARGDFDRDGNTSTFEVTSATSSIFIRNENE